MPASPPQENGDIHEGGAPVMDGIDPKDRNLDSQESRNGDMRPSSSSRHRHSRSRSRSRGRHSSRSRSHSRRSRDRRRDRDRHRSRRRSRSRTRSRSRSYSPAGRRGRSRSRSRSPWSRSRSPPRRNRRDRSRDRYGGGPGYMPHAPHHGNPMGPPDGDDFNRGPPPVMPPGIGGYGGHDPHFNGGFRDPGPYGAQGGPAGPYGGGSRHYGNPPPPRGPDRGRGRHRRDDGPPGVSLLVRNVAPDITAQELEQAFGRIGNVRDVYIPRDYHSQQPKGFAFVEYASNEQAREARNEMDKFVVRGRELEVVFAQEKRKTPNEMRDRVVDGDEGNEHVRHGNGGAGFNRSSSFERHKRRERQRERGGR